MYTYNNIDFYLTFIQFLIFVGLYNKAVYKVLILKEFIEQAFTEIRSVNIFQPTTCQKVCNHLERFMMIIHKIKYKYK